MESEIIIFSKNGPFFNFNWQPLDTIFLILLNVSFLYFLHVTFTDKLIKAGLEWIGILISLLVMTNLYLNGLTKIKSEDLNS